MNHKRAIELLDKYFAGDCTPEERMLVERAYEKEMLEIGPELFEEKYAYRKARTKRKLEDRYPFIKEPGYRLWLRIGVAAAVLLALSIGLLFYGRYALTYFGNENELITTNNNFRPGSNKAFLTLGNGRRVALTDAANGTIAQQSDVEVRKTADGQLVYVSGPRRGDQTGPMLNTVETPRGGQYQVRLPDGTQVWLNASSKLSYPVSFATAKERIVQLSGEAYFEVAKDRAHPFKVKSKNQEVEVLGTHFNISNYADDRATKTTLLEGAVQVNAGNAQPVAILKPGQQASLQGGALQVSEVNTQLAVAWKDGLFMFRSEKLSSIMKKIERWYDVDIVYEDNTIPDIRFSGTISRYDNVSKLLDILQTTGRVHFKIETNKIIVTNHF